jgi:hypothetical protein
LFKGYRIVVVTDRSIVVLRSGMWRPAKPKGLITRSPRPVRIGPASGLWAHVNIAGEQCWVHKRFHQDIEQADAAIGAASGPTSAVPGWGPTAPPPSQYPPPPP